MAQINPGVIKALNHLYRIVVAGEKGFAVAAKNVSNRGLKLLFKTYAQQRAEFAGELAKEIRRLGGKVTERGSIRGLIHRGRIDIVAALTIGEENRERVVLGEAVQGERAALRTYERTLQVDLPPETRSIVERQHAAVKEVSERVALMRGKAEDRLVVRLFDSDQDLNEAIAALREADFPPNAIKTIGINEVHTLYEGRGSTVMGRR